jgi:DNA-binding transcriptional ArsR family regulator
VPRQLVLVLGADDWARSRFVRSLLFEVTQAVRALMHPRQQVHQRAWLDALDQVSARNQLPILAALNPPAGWVPDFLAPPPQPNERQVDDELAEVAAYPPALVAADLRRSLEAYPTRGRRAVLEPLIADPDAALAQIVAELRRAWSRLISPFWSPVRELINADIGHRSQQITRHGLGRALEDLHPSVSWQDGAVRVSPAFEEARIDVAGQGLALMPSAFCWPDLVVVHEPPWPPTIVYPARGIGDLWTAPPLASAGLAGVLGHTRALLLADLARPSTTTALADRHHLSPAAISAQLGRLREAGLISGQRLGKEVYYCRTSIADALIHAAAPAPSTELPGTGTRR